MRFRASDGQGSVHPRSEESGLSLCFGRGSGGENGEASLPGPPGTKGLTLCPPASSREEGRAPGSDPSPGPALTSPSPYPLHFGWARSSGAFGGVWHLRGSFLN